jgi:hypothetical protein
MTEQTLDTDYLIVGCGAAGIGFADVLVSETQADVVIVDQRQAPGGHWNDAYPFVRLHHPSHYYGVASRMLGDVAKQREGFNAGLLHMASAAEILSHYQQVMQQHLLASGRVRYIPMSRIDADGTIVSLLTGGRQNITVRKRTVDATMSGTTVPATHNRPYAVAKEVRCIPLGELTRVAAPPSNYTVIGSGKTGMDACLWLLERGVSPEMIRWIMPRDAWWMDRAKVQFTADYFDAAVENVSAQMEALGSAASIVDLFAKLEASGSLLRLDAAVEPTMFHGATISLPELQQLRRIKNIVRLGRVTKIEADQIVLDRGTVPTEAGTLYVDCSASGFAVRPVVPVFNGSKITLQMLKSFQPTFSAALTAHLEARDVSDAQKNALSMPVPAPKHATDWLRMLAVSMANQNAWSSDPELMAWILKCRLDPMTALMRNVDPSDTAKMETLQRARKSIKPAAINLQTLMGQLKEQRRNT